MNPSESRSTSTSSPRTCPVAASATTPTTVVSPFTRTTVSSAPVTVARPRALMRETETPKAARRRLSERGDRPSAHASAAHPLDLSAEVAPSGQCLKALSQSEQRYRTAATLSIALAGVGAFVRARLDLSGDESYSFHGRELLSWGAMISQLRQDFPPYFSPTVSETVASLESGTS